ncbi:MAG: adenylyl-sulfate kinase, partial [Bacteroidetes bacterium]|nr:adenylyl-sulfate kinase [Bacteroidota bacterium]
MVISLIGKSSSGKSTVANAIANQLRKSSNNIVVLDGDELRSAIAPDLGFSYEDREESEARRSQLMKLLSDQGITVICAGISNYPKWRGWCRTNITNYIEVYLRVSENVLEERDLKGVYKTNVPEIDIDSLPNPVYGVKRMATYNETIILKACKKKGKVTSSWVRDYLKLPDRTSNFVLNNLERQK